MGGKKAGMVYLIGAGPGDPDLITIKGLRCLKSAHVVVYDYLVNESLLSLAGRGAEIIYVGKKSGLHTMHQRDINRLLVEKAKEGLTVARLKGGDPFIFGRGGEEAESLSRAGIEFEIIPGITSAIAVPAYAGIPLTHRDYSSAACLITGHEDPEKDQSKINWESLARFSGTLVFLMGIANLEKIVGKLIDNGLSEETPVGVVSNGTTPSQRTVTGTLGDICDRCGAQGLKPPGIIIVGDVVNLKGSIDWFESRPLFGRVVLVTRPQEQAHDFTRRLSDLGARCILLPTIAIEPPESWKDLDQAIGNISAYDWILFTSINGVRYFFDRLYNAGKDARSIGNAKIGAIGPKSEEALVERGISPDLVPEDYFSGGVADALREYDIQNKRILMPRPLIAGKYLPDKLRKMGALVDEVEAYRTVQPKDNQVEFDRLMKEEIDVVTFTSPSTVRNFMAMFKNKPVFKKILRSKIACIGPVTEREAVKEGLKVSIVANTYTAEGLSVAIADFLEKS